MRPPFLTVTPRSSLSVDSDHLDAARVGFDRVRTTQISSCTQLTTPRLAPALCLHPSRRYAGIRARTTAAPQQHWFGPSGDPRAGGIHTAEAIKLCWSSHREIIHDYGPVSPEWNPVQT